MAGKQIDGTSSAAHGHPSSQSGAAEICVVDADDLLDDPEGVIRAYCDSVGLEFRDSMINWGDDEEHQKDVQKAFEKWKGWHEDALDSTCLRARGHVS